MSRASRAQKGETVDAVLRLLVERWPRCFSLHQARRRPLKINIHLDLIDELDGAITPAELAMTLGCYVANELYLRKCRRAGASRIGLNGEPAGKVTQTDSDFAKIKLYEITHVRFMRRSAPRTHASDENSTQRARGQTNECDTASKKNIDTVSKHEAAS